MVYSWTQGALVNLHQHLFGIFLSDMFAHVFICNYAALHHTFYRGSLCCTLSNGGDSRTLYFYKKDGDIQMKRNRKVLNFFATIETQVKVAFRKLKGFCQSDNKTSDNIMKIFFGLGTC